MATKVKETPILRGSDARRFEKNMKVAEQKKATKEELNVILEAYRSIIIKDNAKG